MKWAHNELGYELDSMVATRLVEHGEIELLQWAV
jgi:hypothetical protein